MAHTQVATGGLMEKIEARALANKKSRANFYNPDVQYERLTPIMRRYLETVGEKLVAACSKGMAEEAKRANILAAMPKNAPGYESMARNFELERIREQKIIQKILNERDQKLAKATRFQKHIPPPSNPDAWTDNEDWVNAVTKQAVVLGIDSKREKEYELLPLAAESLEAPLPPGWKLKHGGSKDMLRNGFSSLSSTMTGNNSSASSKKKQQSEPKDESSSKKVLTSYVNKSIGAVLFEHPLNSYFRSIASSRKVAQELEANGSKDSNAYQRCFDAEHAMRLLMDKLVNPQNYDDENDEEEEEEHKTENERIFYDNEEKGFGDYFHHNSEFENSNAMRRLQTRENNTGGRGQYQNGLGKGNGQEENSQSLTYRESLNFGQRRDSRTPSRGGQGGGYRPSTSALPRLAPYEVGVQLEETHRFDGKDQFSLPSPLNSPGKNNVSFKWSDDDEFKQEAFHNINHSTYSSTTSDRPRTVSRRNRSVLADQRDERRRQAELTDPHTQKIAAPKGCFDDELYASARKLVGNPRYEPPSTASGARNRSRMSSRGVGSRGQTTRYHTASMASLSSSSSSSTSISRANSMMNTHATTEHVPMATMGQRPGTTLSLRLSSSHSTSSSSSSLVGHNQTLRKAKSLPPSPSTMERLTMSSFGRNRDSVKTPLASFMHDF